jgi:hypothetical protein
LKFNDPTNFLKDEVAGTTWIKYQEPEFTQKDLPFEGYAFSNNGENQDKNLSAALFGILPQEITGDVTLEAWVAPETTLANQGIISVSANPNYLDTDYWQRNGTVVLKESGGYSGANEISSPRKTYPKQWSHRAFVRKDNKWFYYVDGNLVNKGDNNSSYIPMKYVVIGNFYDGHYPFMGKIKEIKIWNEARYKGEFTPEVPTQKNIIVTEPISYLKFDNYADPTVDEKGLTWTKHGKPQVLPGLQEHGCACLYPFGDSQNYLSTRLSSPLNEEYTIECFHRTKKGAADGYYTTLFSLTTNENDIGAGTMYVAENNLMFPVGGIGVSSLSSREEIWDHIALTKKDGKSIIYQNGHKIFEAKTDNIPINYVFIARGMRPENSYGGQIDEFKLFNKAIYTGEFIPEQRSPQKDNLELLSYLKFDNSDNLLKDDVLYDWIKVGSPTFSRNCISGNTAYSNNGSNSAIYVDLPRVLDKDWTFEFWMYDSTGALSGQGIMLLSKKPGAQALSQSYQKVVMVAMNQIMDGEGNWKSPTTSMPVNKWFHVAVSHSHDESKTRFFYDGKLVGEFDTPSQKYLSAVIGNNENQYPFLGEIDEVKIWSDCKYKANFTPETPPARDTNILQIQVKDGATQDLAGNTLSGTWDLAPADIPSSPSGRRGFNLNKQNNVTAGPFLLGPYKKTSDWTIEYYYYAPQELDLTYLFWGNNYSSNCIYIRNTTYPLVIISGKTLSYRKNPAIKEWHHVAIVNEASKKKTFLYIDGKQLSSIDSADYNDVSSHIGYGSKDCYVDNIHVATEALYHEEWYQYPEPQNVVLPIDNLNDLLFLDTGEKAFKDAGENTITGHGSIVSIQSQWKGLWAHGSSDSKGGRTVSVTEGPFKDFVFDKDTPWTIAFWFTIDTDQTEVFDNTWGSIFGYENTFNLNSRPRTPSVGLYNSSDGKIVAATSNNYDFLTQWTHFAFVNNPETKRLTAYLNGHAVESVELSQPWTNKDDVTPIPILENYSHAVENFCVVKKALWTSDFTPPQGHLVLPDNLKGKSRYQPREHEILHLEFDEPDNLEKDTSGRRWKKVSDKNYKYSNKGINGCYSCNAATNGIFSLLPSPIKKGTPYTLEVIWKSREINQDHGIAFLTSASTGVSGNLTASEVGIGTYDFLFGTEHCGNISPAANKDYLKVGWHHSAISYDGNKFKCFIDGKKVYEREDNFGDWTYNSILAGAWYAGSGYNIRGLMDEVLLSDYAKYTEEFIPTLPEESGEILHLKVQDNKVVDLCGATSDYSAHGGLIPLTKTIAAPPSGNTPINAQGHQRWISDDISNRTLTAQNDWTIHTWVYPEKEEEENPVSICMTDNFACCIYWFYPGKGLAYGNRSQWVANNEKVFGEPEKWNHIALVNKANDKFRIFLNGKPVIELEPQEGFMINQFYVGSDNRQGFYLDDFVVNEKKALWTSEFALKGMPEQSLYNKEIEDKVVTGLKSSDFLVDLHSNSVNITDNSGGILTTPANFPLAQGRMRRRKSNLLTNSSKFNYSPLHKHPELKQDEPWTIAFYANSPQVNTLLGTISTNGVDELNAVIPFSDWYHLAIVNDGTHTKIFINGELKKTVPSFALDLGKDHPKDITLGGAQDTRVENFFIVKKALWSENFEIPNGHFVYDKSTDKQWTDGAELVHLKFNDQNDLFHDECGNVWTYNFEGEDVWEFNSKRKKEGAGSGFAKKVNNGHAFFRMPEWFKGKQDFTLETWVYITNANGSSYFFLHDQASPIMDHTNKNSLLLHDNGLYINSSRIVQWDKNYIQRWVHFAIVRDGSTWGLFTDGHLIGKWTGDIDFEPRWFVLNGYYDNRYSTLSYYDEVILTAGSKWKVDVADPTFVPPYMITDGSDKPQNPNQQYPVPVESSDILLAVSEEEGNAVDHAKNPWTSLAGYKIKAGRWKDTRSVALDSEVGLSNQTGPLAEQVVLRKDEPWTVAFWFKQLSPQSGNTFILYDGIQLNDQSYPGKSGMRLGTNSIVNLNTDWAEGNIWTYFTIVNDPEHNRIRMYYDGKLQAEKKNEKNFNIGNPSLGSSPGTLIDDFIVVKKALWTDEFEPPTGRFPKPELLGFNYKYYLSGNKKIMFYVDNSNNLHQEDWSSLNPAQKIQKIHAASGNPLTKDMLTSIKTATKSLIKVEYSSKSIPTMKKDINIEPKSQLVIPNKRYSLKGKTQVKAVKFEGENLNLIKVAFTDDLDHWYIWQNNDWQEVLKKDIPTQGMAADIVRDISDWNKFVRAGYIGIAYYLPAGASLDKALITVDSAGKWRRYNQDEASYQYPAQGKLEVMFIQEGSYKINFNKGEAKK